MFAILLGPLRLGGTDDQYIATKGSSFFESFFPIMDRWKLISAQLPEHRERFRGISVVVHNHDLETGKGLFELQFQEI